MGEDVVWSCPRLHALVEERFGYAQGAMTEATLLRDCGLSGLNLLIVIQHLELIDNVAYPADLVSSLESVGDLIYYANVKLAQRSRDHDASLG